MDIQSSIRCILFDVGRHAWGRLKRSVQVYKADSARQEIEPVISRQTAAAPSFRQAGPPDTVAVSRA